MGQIATQQAAVNLPAHLQGVTLGVTDALMSGIYSGGNRIGLKSSRFRRVVNGVEEEVYEQLHLDVILLAAAPAVSRIYYGSQYSQSGENKPPTCYSADGIAPPVDLPTKQSEKCATCPQNIKGSKMDGGNAYKACGYFRRLVVMIADPGAAGNIVDDSRAYRLDVKSQGIFGDGGANNEKSLNDYIKLLKSRGVDAGQIVTRMSFDPNSSTPKLVFKPARYISVEELNAVQGLVVSDEVKQLAEVSMATIDLSSEQSNVEAETAAESAPAPAKAAPQAAQTRPAARPAPRTATPAQAAKPAAQQAAPVADAGLQFDEVPAAAVQGTKQAKPAAPVQEVGTTGELDDILADLGL